MRAAAVPGYCGVEPCQTPPTSSGSSRTFKRRSRPAVAGSGDGCEGGAAECSYGGSSGDGCLSVQIRRRAASEVGLRLVVIDHHVPVVAHALGHHQG